ncbi:N-acetyltransferase [Pseudomonas sp. 5P_5.1_Bac1]|uniref:N-acetyltransferase n=1 Tax=Pseudomonas sp. 5P_5.1_Bac1 TaxID=2971616 RepID=UPI0021CA60DE|nr:N-acetyltransferase [Pseudomonas sp. 5P_5.1_Bac1]MCU1724313.1 N-acetyltransferase [Pseudomonas sp. 5P_5.1_Bac1]
MRALNHIKRKGLRRTLATLWQRYVFFHWELLWMERDLTTPVGPHNLKDHPPVNLALITETNADAFARHFGDRVETMRELAREGHTGHMYLDQAGDAIAFIWASTRDYHDRHYYGCTFPVARGDFFEFGGEMIPAFFGSRLSVDAQVNLWNAMQAKGCTRVVDVVETHNVPALKLHLRMGYHEQGRVVHVYGLFGRWKLFRNAQYSGSRLKPLCAPRSAPVPKAELA